MNNLKRFFLKYRLNIASGLTLFLAFIAVLSIYFSLEIRVSSNDECIWDPIKVTQDSIKMVFKNVKIEGVTYNAGIRDGDLLLQIDNKNLKTTFEAQRILNEFKSGEYADYTIQKPDGKIVHTKVYVKKLIQFGALAQAISALLYLLIGFIVYSAKPDGLAQKLFFGLGVFTVLAAANVLFPFDGINFVDFLSQNPLTAFFAGSVIMISQVLLPIILLYFVWSFPVQFKFVANKSVKNTFITIAVIFIVSGIILAGSLYFTNFKSLKWYNLWQTIVQENNR